jgi:four helix bundle protein
MVANDFTELVAWQLAEELDRFMSDAPRNIAEGFGRFAPKEFAQFLRIAIGSEHETRNHILKAAVLGAITEAERDAAIRLSTRIDGGDPSAAIPAITTSPRQRRPHREPLNP